MDWIRAKQFFAVMLLMVNVFLLVNILQFTNGDSLTLSFRRNAQQTLEEMGLSFAAGIPGNTLQPGHLQYAEHNEDMVVLLNALSGISSGVITEDTLDAGAWTEGAKTIQISEDRMEVIYSDTDPQNSSFPLDEKQHIKYLRRLMRNMGLTEGRYILDYSIYTETGIQYVFIQKYENFYLFRQYVKITLGENGITEAEIFLRQPVQLVEDKDMGMVTVYQILFQNKDEFTGREITDIQLGFYSEEAGVFDDTAVWRITVNQSEFYYFDTITGNRIYSSD